MPTARPLTIDLTTIFGRVIATLRSELKQSQGELATSMRWDRSLLARIESGRNTATIDNIVELEEAFMQPKLIGGHGDLIKLTGHVVIELQRRGHRPVYGHLPKPEGDEPIDAPALDRIVARVVDDWLTERREPPKKGRKRS